MWLKRALVLLLLLLLCCLVHYTAPQHTKNIYAGCQGVAADWVPECWSATYAEISFGGDRTLYFTPYTSRCVCQCFTSVRVHH